MHVTQSAQLSWDNDVHKDKRLCPVRPDLATSQSRDNAAFVKASVL